MQQITADRYRDNPAANYESWFVPVIGAPLAEDLVELARLRPGERVLDVACGTGVVARAAAERIGGAGVVGVDVAPAMLEVARDADPDGTIEWHRASAESLPFADTAFDVVLCQLGLQFFPDRQGALREMRRVLREDGRVLLNVPGPTPPLFAVLERALARRLGPEGAAFVALVFSLYEPDELRSQLAGAGFEAISAHSERTALALPAPEDFLWQYVYSTPLAAVVAPLDADERAELQRDVVREWQPFTDAAGGLSLEVDVTTATASTRPS
jgi:ubiquinone/menaquinone biosynthesis C-methylase UbiE